MKPAHAHLLSVVSAEMRKDGRVDCEEPWRLLDVGCGYGQLMKDALRHLPKLGIGERRIEIYGYEVYDHRGSTPEFLQQTCSRLGRIEPDIEWTDRIRLGAASEPWPFPHGFFDAAFSNQVIEHVERLDIFFEQLNRVVKPGGFAAHYYPSKSVLVEPHSGVPAAHWVSPDTLPKWLRTLSLLGLGKFRNYRRQRGLSVEAFCEEFQSYLQRYVFLRPNQVLQAVANQWSKESGFKYDGQLLARAVADDWDVFPYSYSPRFRSFSGLAPFSCSTLLQRF